LRPIPRPIRPVISKPPTPEATQDRPDAAIPTYTGLRFYLLPQKKIVEYNYDEGWAIWDRPFNRQVGYYLFKDAAQKAVDARNDAEYVRRTTGHRP
jgi:hypothetical protein